MSDENGFDYKKFMCLMMCPCTMCCGLAYMNSAMKNPPDAVKLAENEAKEYVDQVQGKIFDDSDNFDDSYDSNDSDDSNDNLIQTTII